MEDVRESRGTGGQIESGQHGQAQRAFDMMTKTNGADSTRPDIEAWDWSSTVVVVLALVMVLLLTFEIWTSH